MKVRLFFVEFISVLHDVLTAFLDPFSTLWDFIVDNIVLIYIVLSAFTFLLMLIGALS